MNKKNTNTQLNITVGQEIYTLKQVCELLEVKERSIGDALRSGELKGYKKLNKWYILKSDLIAYISGVVWA